jgi:A/G-specific adenine glycosylase
MTINKKEINKIKSWFNQTKRDLPWRNNPSPYEVWISEIMLQQTQVSVVIPYFERWMERFPVVKDLAAASLEEVIKLWEGLGYYSRARNLHIGARQIMENFGGTFPSTMSDLAQIKGLGPYTIGAILSFAYHQKTAAVDGNVMRVLTRYFGIEENVSSSSVQKKIWKIAEEMLPEEEPWQITEGLIELGATLCQRKPKCMGCPLMHSCQGYLKGIASSLPIKNPRVKTEKLQRIVLLLHFKGEWLVKQVPEGKIMSGLHEFPYFQVSEKNVNQTLVLEHMKKELGFLPKAIQELASVKQAFTRYRVDLFPFLVECSEKVEIPGCRWHDAKAIQALPFSSGHRKILETTSKTKVIYPFAKRL